MAALTNCPGFSKLAGSDLGPAGQWATEPVGKKCVRDLQGQCLQNLVQGAFQLHTILHELAIQKAGGGAIVPPVVGHVYPHLTRLVPRCRLFTQPEQGQFLSVALRGAADLPGDLF